MVIVRLYRGSGVISSLIKWQTRGDYSHAAIVVSDHGLYEAKEFQGVKKRLATEKEGTDYDDFIVETTKEQRKILIEFLEKHLNKGYDYTMVIRFLTRQQEQRASTGKFFCSEYVFAGLKKCGVVLFNLTEPWEVSPDDLKRSVLLKKIELS